MGMTLAEKVWADHLVRKGDDGAPDLLYIDLMLMHEVTSPQAFEGLNASAPNAPWVEVCESPHTIVMPGCVSPSIGAKGLRVSEGPPARAAGRAVGPGGRILEDAQDRRRRRVRRRGDAARRGPGALCHVGHQPRSGPTDLREHAHGAAGVAPFRAELGEDAVEALFFRLQADA